MATALYFIDKLALRAGHEKDEDEADTVGCCTLKVGGSACFGWGCCWVGLGFGCVLGRDQEQTPWAATTFARCGPHSAPTR